MGDEWQDYAPPKGNDGWQDYQPAPFQPDTIGVNRGAPPQGSPGYQYSTGYATGDQQRKFSGGAIDRSTSYLGENLSQMFHHPLDTVIGGLGAMARAYSGDVTVGGQLAERYSNDPAALAGDLETQALLQTVGGKPPGVNLATAAKSEFVPSGIARPVAGLQRAAAELQPNLASLIKKPISSAIQAVPNAVKAGLGENVRIYPVERPAPLWQTAGSQPTTAGFNWQGSTPEEIQAQLSRMAARAQTVRPEGMPAEVVRLQVPPAQQSPSITPAVGEAADIAKLQAMRQQALPQMQPGTAEGGMTPDAVRAWQQSAGFKFEPAEDIGAKVRAKAPPLPRGTQPTAPAETPTQPPFPGPKTYEVVRGEDPFTHARAPKEWVFDQDYSSNVKQYGYEPDSQTLSVQYRRGGVYHFKATQQMFNEMRKAPSAGGYLKDVVEPAQTRGAGVHVGTVKTIGQKISESLGGQK